MCVGAMLNARIARVVYGARDDKAGALGSVYDIGRDGVLNHRIEVIGGVMETSARERCANFFASGAQGLKRRAGRWAISDFIGACRFFRVSVNVSKSGPSLTVGMRGAHMTFGGKGIRRTVGTRAPASTIRPIADTIGGALGGCRAADSDSEETTAHGIVQIIAFMIIIGAVGVAKIRAGSAREQVVSDSSVMK